MQEIQRKSREIDAAVEILQTREQARRSDGGLSIMALGRAGSSRPAVGWPGPRGGSL